MKARLDEEEELRQNIHKEAESKLRKDTESVLHRVQNLELVQDKRDSEFKLVQDKIDKIMEMLQKLTSETEETA